MTNEVSPLELPMCQLDEVLHLKQSDRHTVIIDECKMLSGKQKPCSLQDEDSGPLVWRLA